MKTFVLAITTVNRRAYLKSCIDSFINTRNRSYNWKIILADDGSEDGTIEYIDNLQFVDIDIIIIKNYKIGVHQQMNSIFNKLENIVFDFCFKVDDDLTFLKSGWDDLYYQNAIKTGFYHLVFCDQTWCSDQLFSKVQKNDSLTGMIPLLNVQGSFYTLTPEILKNVGYMDVSSFGYRGMGHVDYTMRCARAGYTNSNTPWDINNSNQYLTTFKLDYKGVFDSIKIDIYDNFYRKEKEDIIQTNNRVYIPYQSIDKELLSKFKDRLIEAYTNKVTVFNKEKYDLSSWYENEIEKTKLWYNNQYNHLPNWYIQLGKIFKLIRNR